MQIRAYSMLETILILFIISNVGSIFVVYKSVILHKNEVISDIIHTQFLALQNHERYDFNHNLVEQAIWFNMSGNINQANTIQILGTRENFTIMLHTGRIHD